MNKLKQLALKSKKESVDLKNKVISSVRLKYMVQRKDAEKKSMEEMGLVQTQLLVAIYVLGVD